jgi:hypothetical protein
MNMAITLGGRAPYAPTATIVKVLDRHRSVGLPQIDAATLMRIGVTEPLTPRTLASLKLLGFYDEQGKATSEFDDLRRVGAAELPGRLGMLLATAYAPVLAVIGDPMKASQEDIENAFRGFEPTGQVPRMVQLFTGLMTAAELMPEGSVRKPGPARIVRTPRSANGSKSRTAPTASDVHPSPPASDPAHGPGSAAARVTSGDTYSVALRSGGTVSVVLAVNLFTLTPEDRNFVMTLVDQLTGYNQPATASSDGQSP